MPSEMFGSPIGDIAARELFVKEAMGAANIAALAASTNLHNQQAAELAEKSKAQQALLEAWQKRKQAKTAEILEEPVGTKMKKPSSDFWDAAEDAANVGLFEQSRKLADTASLIDKRLADEDLALTRNRKEQFLTRKGELEAVQGALRHVKDEASFQAVNQWYEETFGRPSPVAGQRYSPELLKRLSNSVLTEKAQLELDIRRADVGSKIANRADQIANRRKKLGLEERRTAVAEERAKRLAKTGGDKPLAGASLQDTKTATQIILNDMFEGQQAGDLPEEVLAQLNEGARAIADEAKRLQRNNPALTRSEAIGQAYVASKQAGDWEVVKRSWYDIRSDQLKFRGMGKSPQTPMRMPEKVTDALTGRYYQNAKGQVGKYLGNGKFELVQVGATRAAAAPGAEEVEDEDEGEEE